MSISEEEKSIRKLRKKIRQAEILDRLPRSLTDEELLKVQNVASYRKVLQSHLKSKEKFNQILAKAPVNTKNTITSGEKGDEKLPHSSDRSNKTANDQTDTLEKVTSPQGDLTSPKCKVPKLQTTSEPPLTLIPNETDASLNTTKVIEKIAPTVEFQPTTSSVKDTSSPVVLPSSVKVPTKLKRPAANTTTMSKDVSFAASITGRKFGHCELVGHSDIIFDISIADDMLASASRDTLVKVWNLPCGSLQSSLSGHTEPVNCVVILSRSETAAWETLFSIDADTSRVVISGGQDSTIRMWEAKTGRDLCEVYTFTPVTCVHLLDNQLGLVVVGNSSGKLEIWSLQERRLVESRSDFDSPVTCIKSIVLAMSKTVRLVVSSESGSVNVYDWSETTGLRLLYANEKMRLKQTPARESHHHPSSVHFSQIRAVDLLTPDTILVSDSGYNLKLLDWRQNEVSKSSIFPGEVCVADALTVARDNTMAGVVLAAGICLDTNSGFVSAYEINSGGKALQHLGSLEREGFGRVLSLGLHETPDGLRFLVTGGCTLDLWQIMERTDPDVTSYSSRDILTLSSNAISNHDVFSTDEEDEEFSDTDNEEDDQIEDSVVNMEDHSRGWCQLL